MSRQTLPPEPDAVALLKQVPLFAGLEDSLLRTLAARSRRRSFPRDASLLHAGEPGVVLYVLLKGRVRVQAVTPAGQGIYLAQRGPGDTIGEISLLDGQPRMADVVTMEPTDALMLHRDDFVACVRESPDLAMGLIVCLAYRLREAGDLYASQQTQDLLGRVSSLLLTMARERGIPDGEGRRIPQVSQASLADQLGTARESVNRAFARLKQVGAIRVEGRQVLLLDEHKLRLYASS